MGKSAAVTEDLPVHGEPDLPESLRVHYEMAFVAPKDSVYQFLVSGTNRSSLQGARFRDYETKELMYGAETDLIEMQKDEIFRLHFQPDPKSEAMLCVRVFNTAISSEQLPSSLPTIQRIRVRTARTAEIQEIDNTFLSNSKFDGIREKQKFLMDESIVMFKMCLYGACTCDVENLEIWYEQVNAVVESEELTKGVTPLSDHLRPSYAGTPSIWTYKVDADPDLCYAYRGELSGYMNVQYTEQNADGNGTRKYHEFRAFDEPNDKTRWHYACNNLWEILTTADGTGGNVHSLLAFKLVPNQMLWKELAEFYVDTVSLSVQPTETDPDAFFIRIHKNYHSWAVILNTVFLKVVYDLVFSNSLNLTIILTACKTDNVHKVSTCFQPSFIFAFQTTTSTSPNKTSALSVDQESQKSAERILSMHPSLGTVLVVTRSGCSQMVYDIHFSLPGRQPLIAVVDQSGLNDKNARVDVELVQDGHLLLCPIPGDMLSTMEPEPQVRVYVNEIPAKCVGTCAHNFDSSMTPRPIGYTVRHVIHPAGRKVMLAVQANVLDHEKPEYNQIIATHEGMIYNASIVLDSWAHFVDISAKQIPAGVVKFQLYVMSKGYSETDFEVDFGELFAKPFSFDPNEGGLAGGTLLTIDGASFSKTAQVMLGDKECDIISVVYDEIQCLTPKKSTEGPVNIRIKQNGLILHSQSSFHYKLDLTPSLFNVVPSDSLPVEVRGPGYRWEPSTLDVVEGDRVTWTWNMPTGQRIKLGIYEADDKFDGQALFAFRQCMTPRFRQPKVQNDTLYIRFTFPMERVQLCSDQWRVTVDGFICIPEGSFSTDATKFTCRIPSMLLHKTNQTDMHLFIPRMNHPKLGYALFTGPSSIAASEHTLNLQISNRDSRLQQGSLYGGGLLHIFGSGFESKRPDVYRIRLGHRFECIVQTVRHNTLVCRVQKIDKRQLDYSDSVLLTYVLEMKNVNSSTWDTISCPGSATQCAYNLNKSATPYLISVQPTMVTEAVLLQLTGENLLQADEDVQQIEIMVGPIRCLAQAYNKTAKQLTCQLAARIPYGKNPISYLVKPRGYGFVPHNLHVTANIQLDRITPDSVNRKQRTAVIKLTGNGLDLSGLTVRIGPFGCIPIDEVFSNPTEISCMLIMSNRSQLRPRTPVDLALYTTGPDPLLTVTNAFTFISDSGDPDTAGDIVCPIGPNFSPCWLITHLSTGLQLPPETVSGLTMATGAVVRTELLTVTSIDPQIDMKSANNSLEMACDIKITAGKHNAIVKQAYTYLVNMTPVIHGISPQSGTTRGGTRLRLFGEMLCRRFFDQTVNAINKKYLTAPVIRAFAFWSLSVVRIDLTFQFIDLWSSESTWSPGLIPVQGDIVIIRESDVIVLDIGTSEEPFTRKATIVLLGHARDRELPLYGSKVIAVRNGRLSIHGTHHPIMWARLAQTAMSGAKKLKLDKSVTWPKGEMIIISSSTTGLEDEQHVITDQYQAVCSAKLFEVPVRQHFGGHIFVGGAQFTQSSPLIQMENVLLSSMGQAGRPGSHPIYFHMSGKMPGSYVRNCIIRLSQNRGVVLRHVEEFVLENNIFHGIKGSAIMLVDGAETGNVLRNNLVIRVRLSRFLDPADLEPAAFWISNPDNKVEGNVAAGGIHTAFRNITWIDTSNRVRFDHPFEFFIRDLDGSVAAGIPNVTVIPGALIVPYSEQWPRDQCGPFSGAGDADLGPSFSQGKLPGVRCDPEVMLIRLSLYNVEAQIHPKEELRVSLFDKLNSSFTNSTTISGNDNKWVVFLVSGNRYILDWMRGLRKLYNLNYEADVSGFRGSANVTIRHVNVPAKPNYFRISVDGALISFEDQLRDSKSQVSGWASYNESGKFVEYFFNFNKSDGKVLKINFEMRYDSSPVFDFAGIHLEEEEITGKPTVFLWSQRETWTQDVITIPRNGSTFTVGKQVHLKVDTNLTISLSTILIQGILEFESGSEGNERAYYLQCQRMLIDGGTLIAGHSVSDPLSYASLVFHLRSQSNDTVQLSRNNSDSNVMVFGQIQLHATRRHPSWVRLAETAPLHATELHLIEAVQDWQVGDLVVVAATGKHYQQTENAIIRAISSDRRTITIDRELNYQHVAYNKTFGTELFQTGAEVAVIHSNIVIRSEISTTHPGSSGYLTLNNSPRKSNRIFGHQFSGRSIICSFQISTNCSSSVPVTELEDEQAVVDITEADGIMWKDNTIAGASCIGLKTRGSPCVSYLPENERDTVIHTCPLGVLNTQSRRFCAQLHYLKIYSTSHVAVFWSRANAIGAHHIQLVDNEIGFYPVLEQVRRAAFFQRANTLLIRESLVVGRSGLQPCDEDGEQLLVRSLPKPVKSVGHVGAVISQFICPLNSRISDETWEVNGAYWEKITFVNFGHWCATDKDVVLRSDMSYRNSIQNAFFRQTKVINVPSQNMLLYQQPSRPENILYCGELECDSSKQVFILDTDGGLFGKPTVALPRYAFTQDALKYIKMNFPLRRRLTARGIDLIPIAIWPYHGIVRDRACIREGRRRMSLCSIQPEHRLLLIQPLEVNKVKAKRLGPAVFTTEHNSEGFIDLINGRIGCKDAECKMSREVFPLIVTNGSISSVYFTRQNPDALHLRLSEAEDTYKMHLQIDYRQGARLDVYVQKNYRLPQNGVMDEMVCFNGWTI
ncbi:hypothetical protein FGIG_00917 [Fasciola gigantica]|uniref:G8 domain-containing protein n=1 Tax=Fasciola gigantica TaxID=46835 RepID=A0A504ZEB6_FASGI|nr:hypothetical protein FGIG_00917 [Fasciola gigantica]